MHFDSFQFSLDTVLDTFRYQAAHCEVYKQYIDLLGINPQHVQQINDIPFLPIQFFKSHQVYAFHRKPEIEFESSGTGKATTSKHFVAHRAVYENSYQAAFNYFYGPTKQYTILALLPSYLERTGSSLIYMVDGLIKDILQQAPENQSGFYLHNHEDLYQQLQLLQKQQQKCLLIGVSFALLDFVEQYAIDFPELIVMETGGMKGKRPELSRSELHQIISSGFGVQQVHSEYGMTELLSQAYSAGQGKFFCPPWMQVVLRDIYDPFTMGVTSGGINVIDLANYYSCSFIETQDLGRITEDGGFEVLGRFDNSEIRGCNLLLG